MPVKTEYIQLENPSETKFVTIAPGIPMTKDNKPLGFALMVLKQEGDTGPTLVYPLDSPEEAAGFLLAVTQCATVVFGDKLEAAMAELSESKAATDASSDGVAH